jgi:hypothetical protein
MRVITTESLYWLRMADLFAKHALNWVKSFVLFAGKKCRLGAVKYAKAAIGLLCWISDSKWIAWRSPPQLSSATSPRLQCGFQIGVG